MCMRLSRITGRGRPRVARVRAVARSGSGVTRDAHSEITHNQANLRRACIWYDRDSDVVVPLIRFSGYVG
jgi:hypothetical protein